TLDLPQVLTTILAHAVRLSQTDAGAIYEFVEASQRLDLRVTHGVGGGDAAPLLAVLRAHPLPLHESFVGQAVLRGEPIQLTDLGADGGPPAGSPLQAALAAAGFQAMLAAPLLREGQIFGALIVRRRTPGPFGEATVKLVQTLATQSVLAIQNARLY